LPPSLGPGWHTTHGDQEARNGTDSDPTCRHGRSSAPLHAWLAGNTVYVAGQLALDKGGKLVGPNDIGAQTRQIFENMRRVLEGGGASLRDVVKVTVFVTDIRYRDGYGEVRQEFFRTDPPASTLVQVAGLAIPGALIEIEAVAVID
jgi:2-iminobutanoate/2-iminopropanoate deaminase